MTTIASLRRDYLAGNRELESSVRTFESFIRSALDVQDDVAWISLATAQEIDEQIEALRGVGRRLSLLFPVDQGPGLLLNHQSGRSMDLLKELLQFFIERKKFWLAPVIVMLLLIGALLIFGAGSALAPFIYTLF